VQRRLASLPDKKESCGEATAEPGRLSLERCVKGIVEDELVSARAVMSAMNARDELNQFNDTLSRYFGNDTVAQFSLVRALIADTIKKLSPDGYRLPCAASGPGCPDELVRKMIERSSEELGKIFSNSAS
jgi:hypothetical protein